MHVGLKQLCRFVCFKVILYLLVQYRSVSEVMKSQFEDFQMKWAFETLQRYRNRFCMFNDDVQVLGFSNYYYVIYSAKFCSYRLYIIV